MGLFSGFNFPWTDLHTLNLDWLLRSVKSLLDRYNPVAKSEDMTQPVGVDETGKLYTTPSEAPPHAGGSGYGTVNPVASTSDMTQPVGVDETGKLYTTPSEDPPHAAGSGYGTVNPVASTSDMTQPVGVGSDGKLFTKSSGDTPHADGTNFGTVNPVAKKDFINMTRRVGVDSDGRLFAQETEIEHARGENFGTVKPIFKTADMTQPVGVNDQGRLFTNPGGGGSGETKVLLYTIGDVIVMQRNKPYTSETFWSNYDYYEIEIGCNTKNDDSTKAAARLTYKAYWNSMQATPVGIACFSYDAESGVLYRVVTPHSPNDFRNVTISEATSLDGTTTYPSKCHILNIYGIRKGEA